MATRRVPQRPPLLFDRESEWADLSRFCTEPSSASRLGLVYGRRRAGKSFMLESLTAATGGFFHQALEEARAPALESLAATVASFAGLPRWAGGRFDDWRAAIRAVAEQAAGRPIVIDDFPYLLRESPELPSVIQAAYDGSRSGRHPVFRLLLCGSALSVMTGLLTGQQALRGRAVLDMPVHSFDFREARAFWQIPDPEVGFLVHAVLGGPPGYRDLLAGAVPATVSDFEDWLAAGVLDPSHALFREAEYLLAEDPSLVGRALYRSIIAAIARGKATRRGVGEALQRPDTALDHPLTQLERAQFIVRDADLLRPSRPLLRVADPLLRFHFAVLRPDLARFEARQTHDAWVDGQASFRSQVLGPHFESLARAWTRRYASARSLGGRPKRVGFVQVNDPVARQSFELDVVAEAPETMGGKRVILAIGEAKGSDSQRSANDIARLERLRGLLASRADVSRTRLLLFARSGFHADVIDLARRRRDVELVDLDRLYGGD
ncbi:MAG: ATP-binding protein [Chloroflexi bacterium]|nr:ATP-binding protein [Chloroflexota bacterium]